MGYETYCCPLEMLPRESRPLVESIPGEIHVWASPSDKKIKNNYLERTIYMTPKLM